MYNLDASYSYTFECNCMLLRLVMIEGLKMTKIGRNMLPQ
jgi:hypothetical protein